MAEKSQWVVEFYFMLRTQRVTVGLRVFTTLHNPNNPYQSYQ
jgi:hypothetical protein